MPDVRCGSCGEDVPEGPFCVRCGAHLGDDPAAAAPSRSRGAFAAAPHQRLNVPWLVSSLFPHLPRRSMVGFRVSLAFGWCLVLVLGVLRILPVALIAAAVLLPLLTLLYLREVDIYEDEPLRVIALTMLWGAVAGVAVGLLTRAVTSTGAAYLIQSQGTTIAGQGILLPLLGLVLALVGPLVLLRYRRFNDVLDGVTFGACAGAAFAGAEVITYGFSILSGGLRPGGAVLDGSGGWRRSRWRSRCSRWRRSRRWRARSGCASERRCAIASRSECSAIRCVALVAAAVLLAVGFSLQPLMATGWWLLCLLALDGVALLWLRRVIHLGLLEESAEIPIGPPITCANCGAQTPRAHLLHQLRSLAAGVAQAAARDSSVGGRVRARRRRTAEHDRRVRQRLGRRSRWRGGEHHGRSGQGRIIIVFAVLFMLLAGLAVLFAALEEPAAPKSVCPVAPGVRQSAAQGRAALVRVTVGAASDRRQGVRESGPRLSDRVSGPVQHRFADPERNRAGLTQRRLHRPAGGRERQPGHAERSSGPRPSAPCTARSPTCRPTPPQTCRSCPRRSAATPALAASTRAPSTRRADRYRRPMWRCWPPATATRRLSVVAICANRNDTVQFLDFVDQAMLDTLRFQADVAR